MSNKQLFNNPNVGRFIQNEFKIAFLLVKQQKIGNIKTIVVC